ncbi:MAG: flippase [Armatimonadetes bacterium]|nr:flippase [Armatimonadota bacterium]
MGGGVVEDPVSGQKMTVAKTIRRAARSTVARNAAALYGVRFAAVVLPLVTVPYLARLLQPAGWGLVLFSRSFSSWLVLAMEYGFQYFATRKIARNRGDREAVAETVSDVLGAKCVLATAAIAVALIARYTAPIFRTHPEYLIWALVLSLAQGFIPLWYFQGTERITTSSRLTILAYALGAACTFIMVRAPDQGVRVLILNAASALLVAGGLLGMMYRQVPWRRPKVSSALRTLRESWSTFVFQGGASFYQAANGFVLGLFVPPAMVAYYGGAERLVRLATSLVDPISWAVYPRISHLMAHQTGEARRYARTVFLILGGLGLCMGGVFFLGAPLLIGLLYGASYTPAIPVLRILSLTIPVIALGTVFAIQWALPAGLERPLGRVAVAAGIGNVGLAVVLAPRFGALGMACAVLSAESFVMVSAYVILKQRRLLPFPIAETLLGLLMRRTATDHQPIRSDPDPS